MNLTHLQIEPFNGTPPLSYLGLFVQVKYKHPDVIREWHHHHDNDAADESHHVSPRHALPARDIAVGALQEAIMFPFKSTNNRAKHIFLSTFWAVTNKR